MLAVVLALAVLAVAAGNASARTDRQAAVLRLVDMAPVTFRGSQFVSGEDVRVTLHRQRKAFVRNVHANANGAFTVRFGLVAIDVCRGIVSVIASGDRGSRATYRRPCRPPDPTP